MADGQERQRTGHAGAGRRTWRTGMPEAETVDGMVLTRVGVAEAFGTPAVRDALGRAHVGDDPGREPAGRALHRAACVAHGVLPSAHGSQPAAARWLGVDEDRYARVVASPTSVALLDLLSECAFRVDPQRELGVIAGIDDVLVGPPRLLGLTDRRLDRVPGTSTWTRAQVAAAFDAGWALHRAVGHGRTPGAAVDAAIHHGAGVPVGTFGAGSWAAWRAGRDVRVYHAVVHGQGVDGPLRIAQQQGLAIAVRPMRSRIEDLPRVARWYCGPVVAGHQPGILDGPTLARLRALPVPW